MPGVNTQAAVRHLQDGRGQQMIHGSSLHMILVTSYFCAKREKAVGFFSADEQLGHEQAGQSRMLAD